MRTPRISKLSKCVHGRAIASHTHNRLDLGAKDDLDGVGVGAIDRGLDGGAVVLQRELVGHDDVIRHETRRENVEGAVDRVATGAAGQTGGGACVDGVVYGSDQRGLLVPNRCQVDLGDTGRTEHEHCASVSDRAQRFGD